MFRNNRYTVAFGAVVSLMLVGGVITACDLLEEDFWYGLLTGDFYYFLCDLDAEVFGDFNSSNLAALSFEANLGQTDGQYPYIARGKRHSILLSATETVF